MVQRERESDTQQIMEAVCQSELFEYSYSNQVIEGNKRHHSTFY